MSNKIPAIPTMYGGTQFRSMLEARWAAFFDLIKWRWTYEPYEQHGWIPDFLLNGSGSCTKHSLLAEVKPITEFCEETANKIEAASRGVKPLSLLLLGATTPLNSTKVGIDELWNRSREQIGWLLDMRNREKDLGQENRWDKALFGISSEYSRWPSIFAPDVAGEVGSYEGFFTGTHNGNPLEWPAGRLECLWREAGNKVQWRKPSRKKSSTMMTEEQRKWFGSPKKRTQVKEAKRVQRQLARIKSQLEASGIDFDELRKERRGEA